MNRKRKNDNRKESNFLSLDFYWLSPCSSSERYMQSISTSSLVPLLLYGVGVGSRTGIGTAPGTAGSD